MLIVFLTISAFSMAAFSFPAKAAKKKKKEYGLIEITASPEQAAVFVEGFNMGTPPLTIEDVPPGIYRVTVKAAGYDDFIEDVKVEKQEVSKVDARMTEGGERTKLPLCDYSFWDSVSKKEKSRLEQAKYSSFLLGYKNIEVANFDLKIKGKKPVPPHLLFPFYSHMIKQLDKYTNFPQIITDYTDIEGMEEVKKVYTSEQAAPGEKTLLLSGVVKKLKKGKKTKNVPAQSFQVSQNIGFAIGSLIKYPPQISILFRLTDKENGYVVYNQLISGSINTVGKDFAKALQEAVDTLLKRKKENGTGQNGANLRLNNNKTKLAVGNWQLAKDRA